MITDVVARAAGAASVRLSRLRDALLTRRVETIVRSTRTEAPCSIFGPADGVDGVARLGFDMGRLDVFVVEGEIRSIWRGVEHHAVPHREAIAHDARTFAGQLHEMTRRHFVDMRRPDAGPHHMTI